MPRSEVYCCSTLLSLVTAVVAGDLDRRPPDDDVRRVLLVSDYAVEAESGQPLLERAGTSVLTGLFDLVVDVNALIAPYHPGAWSPGEQAMGLLGELLRRRWSIGDAVELHVEPYQVNFARWALELFPEAPVTVVADGLMAYGPSRQRIPQVVGRRISAGGSALRGGGRPRPARPLRRRPLRRSRPCFHWPGLRRPRRRPGRRG